MDDPGVERGDGRQGGRLWAARDAAALPPHQPEMSLIWAATEGQVANFGVYLLAALGFWLLFPVAWALYRYLRTASHRYELTDQRLLERSGILVKRVDSLELYRVVDLQVGGTLLQSLFGRGRVTLITRDTTNPTLTLNAIPSPARVAHLIREGVERCRTSKGVRSVDV